MTDKQVAAETLSRLPEAASLHEIAEELRLVAALRQGQADVAVGRVHSHEEVERMFAGWTEQWTTESPSTK